MDDDPLVGLHSIGLYASLTYVGADWCDYLLCDGFEIRSAVKLRV